MRAMHEHPVPEESKQEEKTKRCNECDEEFFPVHNFFRLRLLLSPRCPGSFIAKWRIVVDSKFLSASRSRTNDKGRMTNVERSPNAQITKHRTLSSFFGFRHSFVMDIRHSSFHSIQRPVPARVKESHPHRLLGF